MTFLLNSAIAHNNLEYLLLRLKEGVDPNIREYLIPLQVSYNTNNLQAMEILLEYRADPNIIDKNDIYNRNSDNSQTIFTNIISDMLRKITTNMLEIQQGLPEIDNLSSDIKKYLKLLISWGADMNIGNPTAQEMIIQFNAESSRFIQNIIDEIQEENKTYRAMAKKHNYL